MSPTLELFMTDAIQRANEQPTTMRLGIAREAVAQYYDAIEALGRGHSPELWCAVNPLDRRK